MEKLSGALKRQAPYRFFLGAFLNLLMCYLQTRFNFFVGDEKFSLTVLGEMVDTFTDGGTSFILMVMMAIAGTNAMLQKHIIMPPRIQTLQKWLTKLIYFSILVAICITVIQSISRLINPVPVDGIEVTALNSFGLLVNFITVRLFIDYAGFNTLISALVECNQIDVMLSIVGIVSGLGILFIAPILDVFFGLYISHVAYVHYDAHKKGYHLHTKKWPPFYKVYKGKHCHGKH